MNGKLRFKTASLYASGSCSGRSGTIALPARTARRDWRRAQPTRPDRRTAAIVLIQVRLMLMPALGLRRPSSCCWRSSGSSSRKWRSSRRRRTRDTARAGSRLSIAEHQHPGRRAAAAGQWPAPPPAPPSSTSTATAETCPPGLHIVAGIVLGDTRVAVRLSRLWSGAAAVPPNRERNGRRGRDCRTLYDSRVAARRVLGSIAGVAMAAYAAIVRKPDALILESGFPDARSLLRGSPLLSLLARSPAIDFRPLNFGWLRAPVPFSSFMATAIALFRSRRAARCSTPSRCRRRLSFFAMATTTTRCRPSLGSTGEP